MSTRSFLVPESLEPYINANWIHEPELLRQLRDETIAATPDSNMQISPDLGSFLSVLLKSFGATKTLEVGVFTGYSSTVTALALPDDGRIIACDVSEEFTSIARKYWKIARVDQKIDLRLAPAAETLGELLAQGQENSFDFAFIDADKPNYWTYFDLAVRLVRSNGLIAVDNVLWSGRVADDAVQDESTVAIREFNRRVHDDVRVEVSLVPIGDGLTLARKR